MSVSLVRLVNVRSLDKYEYPPHNQELLEICSIVYKQAPIEKPLEMNLCYSKPESVKSQ